MRSFPLLASSALLVLPASAQLTATVSPRAALTAASPAPTTASLPPAPVGGSDACATADPLGNAVGSFAFDLTAATTGTEGQITFTGGDCNYGCAEYGTGNVQVPGDVWFSWTAPSTGRVRISTCPQTSDAKLAVYSGAVCPTGTSCVACNDDFHGSGGPPYLRDAIVYFDATVGSQFLIQVGRGFSLFTGAGFTGAFTIEVGPLPRELVLDNGTGVVSLYAGAATVGNGQCRMQRFGNTGDVTTVAGAEVSWGWAGQPDLVNGTPCVLAIWDDPNDDGIPTDGVLLQQVPTTMQSVGTDTFVPIAFSPAVTVNGAYFIGVATQLVAAATTAGVNFPMTADNSVCTVQPDSAWYGVMVGGPYDVTNIAANSGPAFRLPGNCQAQGTATYNGLYHSAWTIRSVVQTGPQPVGTGECFGDGTGFACPCGNTGGAGRGCANSSAGSTGAVLTGTGAASIAGDTVTLTCTDLSGPGLFFQASALIAPPVAFGDGILCAGVGIIRMGVVFPSAGAASYPGGLTPNPISIAGLITSPGTFHYQVWYRDAFVFCTTATFNTSSGLAIAWGS